MTLMQDGARGTHIDGDAESEIFRLHFQRAQSQGFLGKTHHGDDSRRPARTLLIYFPVPPHELLLEIFLVLEAPHLEEGRFYEAYQVLDGSFGEKRALQTVAVVPHKFSPSHTLSIL